MFRFQVIMIMYVCVCYGFVSRFERIFTVIFSQASVILLTGGSASVMLGYPPAKETPCQGDPPAKETPLPRNPPAKETPLPRRPPCQGDPSAKESPLCQGDAKETGDPPAKETPPRRPLPRRPPAKETPPPRSAKETPLKGKLRGNFSEPTPKGEIDQIQAHTQGGN